MSEDPGTYRTQVLRLVDYTCDTRSQSVSDLLTDAQVAQEELGATVAIVILARLDGGLMNHYLDVAGLDGLQALGLLRHGEQMLLQGSVSE